MRSLLARCVALSLVIVALLPVCQAISHQPVQSKPQVLAHYMAWYQAKPFSTAWGWHWTMNVFDPDKSTDGRRELASHYRPLIGPYDSVDPDVLEYHLLTMKLAGIDGVIVDWYGLSDLYDYPAIHKNTQRLMEAAERYGMKVAICYEDQTVPALIKAGRLEDGDRVNHVAKELRWLSENWFKSPSYVQLDGRPVLLSFGQSGLKDEEWTEALAQSGVKVSYISQHHRRTAAAGAFDWPVPSDPMGALTRFRTESKAWDHAIPVAFPRFVDIYEQAQVHASYGNLPDDGGKRFRQMVEHGLASGASILQLATWNDWGEGTQIEPSTEFGYRDLETVRTLIKTDVGAPVVTSEQMKLPLHLYQQRQQAEVSEKPRLDAIAKHLIEGDYSKAAEVLNKLESETQFIGVGN
ncbi:MAG TPA: glycoside hydrolase family 71/99-like protein [Fimbriimonadaceae bacterium]|nr:hypothetical protein [Armatimonadota bacterium]HCM72758.1 hypothetical protein [Armatimonadota bacterium]HRD30611.1 glycoside hydrolase family 71/99-like protein [Fimbriimonadaceae bacterium]HRE92728.1 glycoside hydrolase family 71/99-like protein [Fimbriimonadaceae bacterium]HRI74374.1 glycoside hydrolase family 71/99-like protein [Fimbriimonadaceae bacterium]